MQTLLGEAPVRIGLPCPTPGRPSPAPPVPVTLALLAKSARPYRPLVLATRGPGPGQAEYMQIIHPMLDVAIVPTVLNGVIGTM